MSDKPDGYLDDIESKRLGVGISMMDLRANLSSTKLEK